MKCKQAMHISESLGTILHVSCHDHSGIMDQVRATIRQGPWEPPNLWERKYLENLFSAFDSILENTIIFSIFFQNYELMQYQLKQYRKANEWHADMSVYKIALDNSQST